CAESPEGTDGIPDTSARGGSAASAAAHRPPDACRTTCASGHRSGRGDQRVAGAFGCGQGAGGAGEHPVMRLGQLLWRRADPAKARHRAGVRVLLPAALPLAVLGIWWLALLRQWVRPYQLPAPGMVLSAFQEMLARGELQQHLAATSSRTVAGYLLGAVPAVVIGIGAGLSQSVRAFVDPTIQGVRAVPSLAWVPLFLLWLGIGERSRVLLIALGAFLPVYLNALAGVEGVDRRLVEVGRAYGLSGAAITTRIVLPASLPAILTGLRAGLSLAWLFLVAAELIAASNGLGFLLVDGQATMRPDRVLASIVAFALLGRISDAAPWPAWCPPSGVASTYATATSARESPWSSRNHGCCRGCASQRTWRS